MEVEDNERRKSKNDGIQEKRMEYKNGQKCREEG